MPGIPTSPTLFVNGVECSVAMPGGRLAAGESSGEEGPRASLTFQVPFAARWNLVAALRGTSTLAGGAINRIAPYRYPPNARMVCTAVGEFEYIGSTVDASGAVGSTLVKLPAQFSCVPWQFQDGDPGGQNDASGQAWTVTRIKPSCEVYQPAGGSYYVGPFPAGTPLDESSIGFVRANQEIQVTRKMLPAMPLNAITAALGHVNLAAQTFGDQLYIAKTLLLVAAESEPYFDCLGNPVMDVNLTYLAKVGTTWNRVQDRAGNYQFVNSKADGSGSEPFETYNFATLPR